MQARWTTYRLIRRQGRGTNTVADLHAAVAANLGEGRTAYAHVSSTHRVVQSTAQGGASERDARSRSQVGNQSGKEGMDHE